MRSYSYAIGMSHVVRFTGKVRAESDVPEESYSYEYSYCTVNVRFERMSTLISVRLVEYSNVRYSTESTDLQSDLQSKISDLQSLLLLYSYNIVSYSIRVP